MTDGGNPDSKLEVGVEVINQWETEFLQERLQELLRAAAAADTDDSETQVQRNRNTACDFTETYPSQDTPPPCV